MTPPGVGTQESGFASQASSSPLPPPPPAELPRAEATAAPDAGRAERFIADQERALLQRRVERVAQQLVLEDNASQRAAETELSMEMNRLAASRERGVPPANGSDVKLTDQHREVPFDPEVRRELSQRPRQARGRVARQDSVLFDQVGANNRVSKSGRQADQAEARQREFGRREFEMRQQREAEGAQLSKTRAEQRRLKDLQRLETSQLQEDVARAQARRRAIQEEFVASAATRETANQSIAASIETRRTKAQDLHVAAGHFHDERLNLRETARASTAIARQRDVFKLQVAFANTRREQTATPSTGAESAPGQAAEARRSQRQVFDQGLTAKSRNASQSQDTVIQGVDRRNQDLRQFATGRLDQARDRSQNMRRLLASSYSPRGNSSQALTKA